MVEAIQILFMNVLVSESFALFSKLFSAHIDQPLACHNWCWMYRLRFFAVSFPINQIRRIPFLWTTVYKYSLFFRLRFFNSAIKWLFVFARIQAIIDCGCLLQNECEEHNTSDYCICAFDRNSFCQHFFLVTSKNARQREREKEHCSANYHILKLVFGIFSHGNLLLSLMFVFDMGYSMCRSWDSSISFRFFILRQIVQPD